MAIVTSSSRGHLIVPLRCLFSNYWQLILTSEPEVVWWAAVRVSVYCENIVDKMHTWQWCHSGLLYFISILPNTKTFYTIDYVAPALKYHFPITCRNGFTSVVASFNNEAEGRCLTLRSFGHCTAIILQLPFNYTVLTLLVTNANKTEHIRSLSTLKITLVNAHGVINYCIHGI